MTIAKPIAALLICLALGACAATPTGPTEFSTLAPGAAERIRSVPPDRISPALSPRQLTTNFERYCGQFIGDPAGSKARLRADGYFLFATSPAGQQFASSNGTRPIVIVEGTNGEGPKGCSVQIRAAGTYLGALDAYIRTKHGETVVRADDVDVRGRDEPLESLWVASADPVIQYLSGRQANDLFGQVFSFAVFTQ